VAGHDHADPYGKCQGKVDGVHEGCTGEDAPKPELNRSRVQDWHKVAPVPGGDATFVLSARDWDFSSVT